MYKAYNTSYTFDDVHVCRHAYIHRKHATHVYAHMFIQTTYGLQKRYNTNKHLYETQVYID